MTIRVFFFNCSVSDRKFQTTLQFFKLHYSEAHHLIRDHDFQFQILTLFHFHHRYMRYSSAMQQINWVQIFTMHFSTFPIPLIDTLHLYRDKITQSLFFFMPELRRVALISNFTLTSPFSMFDTRSNRESFTASWVDEVFLLFYRILTQNLIRDLSMKIPSTLDTIPL